MKRYFKTLLLSLLAPAVLFAAADAAAFPVPATDEAGVTRWGYMDDDGSSITDFIYSSAGEFELNGLAGVTNEKGKFALIRENGKLATGWLEMPKEVSADNSCEALDYGSRIDYYDSRGSLIGSVEGAKGFPGDGLVVAEAERGGKTLYGYRLLKPEKKQEETAGTQADEEASAQDGAPAEPANAAETAKAVTAEDTKAAETPEASKAAETAKTEEEDDGFAIAPQFQAAGSFRKGRALVQTERGGYAVINTRGQVLKELPEGAEPAALDIYADNVLILRMNDKYALYSLDSMQFATSFSYDEILPFDRAAARCRSGNLWGLLSPDGTVVMEPTYPYLSYMGEGVYAARGTDPGAAAVSETGRVLYSTGTYVGGFQTFAHGYAWHGRLDGSVVFFNTIGTIAHPFDAAEDPQVLTEKTVRVNRGGTDCYIEIRTGETIYSNTRSYDLANGLHISAETYEKYLGLREDGSEYGYHVEYPQISGHADAAVQAKINDTIRSFFVTGPAGGEDRSLDATFGFSVEGNVLVVWANGVSGLDNSAAVWNDSIGIDLRTGVRYTAYDSLFKSTAAEELARILPKGAPYFGSPRMDTEGVTFFRNYPAAKGAEPYAVSVHLTFRQLSAALNTAGACYRALTNH